MFIAIPSVNRACPGTGNLSLDLDSLCLMFEYSVTKLLSFCHIWQTLNV